MQTCMSAPVLFVESLCVRANVLEFCGTVRKRTDAMVLVLESTDLLQACTHKHTHTCQRTAFLHLRRIPRLTRPDARKK